MLKENLQGKINKYLSDDKWLVTQNHYDFRENLKYESLFCLSNGYLGTRGSYEEGTKKSIPCTYINGVFDKSETFMRELANMPNWLGLKLYVEKELIAIEDCEIVEFKRVLNMEKALLLKKFRLKDAKGRETLIEGVRFISRANTHRMGIRLFVTPLNYSSIIEVENITDASVINFCDAPRFKVKHTKLTDNSKLNEQGTYVEVTTRDRELHVGTGSMVTVTENGKDIRKTTQFNAFGETSVEFLDFDATEGNTYEVTKYVSIYTEREVEKTQIKSRVHDEISQFIKDGFEKELRLHETVYEKMWDQADITISGDDELDRSIRFNIFHLMSTGNEKDDRVNVGAKLLHGEEYGGHAFWDTELFMLPFFAHVFPDTAKNLESYRYHLLDAARDNAKKNGFLGAQYPWESADDGTEQCPDWTIEPDGSCYRCYVAVYEHHVTAAVAYGIYNYVKITKDETFLHEKGAEILVETARFWASRCEYNVEANHYEIKQVTGPDEWHEPVDNNLYTNYLAKWNLRYVLSLLEDLKLNQADVYDKLKTKLGFTDDELKSFHTTQEKIYLPRRKDSKLLEQFEGYFDLQEVLIDQYDENDWPIKPEILNTVNKSKTQILKQADVVMLLHLLGHEFDEETMKENYAYYEKRTLHGSSLSPSIYSIMGLKVGDNSKAYRYLKRAAILDLVDLQKNTREGIHAANAGGVWQVVVFGFAGVTIGDEGMLAIQPKMPKEWSGLSFKIHYGGAWILVTINEKNVASVERLDGERIQVQINGETIWV